VLLLLFSEGLETPRDRSQVRLQRAIGIKKEETILSITKSSETVDPCNINGEPRPCSKIDVLGKRDMSTDEGGRALRIEDEGFDSNSKSKPEISAAPMSRTSLKFNAIDADIVARDATDSVAVDETDLDLILEVDEEGDIKLPVRVVLRDLEDVVAAAIASGITEKSDERRETG